MNPLMDTAAVSALTGIPERTFDNYAYRGLGPAFVKIGKHRRYRPEDVEAWIQAHRCGGDAA